MTGTVYESLHREIVEDLTIELQTDINFNQNILSIKVKNAIKEVKLKRNYENSSYSEKEIAKDLERYFSTIRKVALYDYNQIGVEGQQSHSESGISRTWVEREKMFEGVYAFVKVLH